MHSGWVGWGGGGGEEWEQHLNLQGNWHLLSSPADPPSPPLQDEDYSRAAALAFSMRHPGCLLAVVRQALQRGRAEGERVLAQLAGGVAGEDLRLCLEYCR